MKAISVRSNGASGLRCISPDSHEEPSAAVNVDVPLPPPEERHSLVYRSRAMHDLVTRAVEFAKTNATVLITGESGTGKEVIARLLHKSSLRSASRFGSVNCAALSDTLIESELFGHERGAFTGAMERRVGRFEWASEGTLLLDEISEIPVPLQAKLLRVLEESEFQRVGDNRTLAADVRVIATSNLDLMTQVQKGNFRPDLYYRLNVLRLHLPALRDRPDDIPLLSNLFMRRFAPEAARPVSGISKHAMRVIMECPWPGNVRQLRNAIHSACILAKGTLIEKQDLPELEGQVTIMPGWMLRVPLEEIERRVLLEHLERSGGNKTSVAEVLGITTRTITNKLRSYQQQELERRVA